MGKEEEEVGDEEKRKRVQFPHLTTARHASDQVREWKRTATEKKSFHTTLSPTRRRKKLVKKTNSPHSPSFWGEGGGEGNMVWHTEEKIVTAAAKGGGEKVPWRLYREDGIRQIFDKKCFKM